MAKASTAVSTASAHHGVHRYAFVDSENHPCPAGDALRVTGSERASVPAIKRLHADRFACGNPATMAIDQPPVIDMKRTTCGASIRLLNAWP
jgi:hypothetical protein